MPNIIACLAFEKLASYNFCENVTYRAVSLVGHVSICHCSLRGTILAKLTGKISGNIIHIGKLENSIPVFKFAGC